MVTIAELISDPSRIGELEASDISSIVLSALTLIMVVYMAWTYHKQQLSHSMEFILKYGDKILEDHKDVVDIIYARLNDPTKSFDSDKSVRVFLNKLEVMCQYRFDKTIKKQHMLNMFGLILRCMKNDDEVRRIINDAQQINPNLFKYVEKQFKKIN